jgi:hypothetical protein
MGLNTTDCIKPSADYSLTSVKDQNIPVDHILGSKQFLPNVYDFFNSGRIAVQAA